MKLHGQIIALRVLRDDSMWGKFVIRPPGSDTSPGPLTTHTVTGVLTGLHQGEFVQVEGDWVDHPQYGREFKAKHIIVTRPVDAHGIVAWIIDKLPNVGPVRAKAIVDRFGIDGVWDALTNPMLLTTVPGITSERARYIAAAYAPLAAERDAGVTLRGWGLTASQAARAIARWRNDVLDVLREDPYKLMELLRVGFRKADTVALAMGLPKDHLARLRAGAEYALDQALGRGHLYLVERELVETAASGDVLGVSMEAAARGLASLLESGKAVQDGRAIYLKQSHSAECAVAAFVKERR